MMFSDRLKSLIPSTQARSSVPSHRPLFVHRPSGRPALLFGILISVTGMALATSPNKAAGDVERVSFKKQIQPIFDTNCVACHQSGGAQQGLNLEEGASYGALVLKRSQESDSVLVQPASPDASYLLHKLKGTQATAHGSGAQMPLGGALAVDEIAAISAWIAEGAMNN
jgi:mono/diheme cytochrome c family protein